MQSLRAAMVGSVVIAETDHLRACRAPVRARGPVESSTIADVRAAERDRARRGVGAEEVPV